MKEKSRKTPARNTPAAPPGRSNGAARTGDTGLAGQRTITAEERRRMTEEAAYLRAHSRGFSGGTPEQDWYEAEAEIERASLLHSQGE
jgi:hypothetical protein